MQKCLATLLAVLLLFGGTGMVFGQHFCEGVVVEKAFSFGPETMNCAEVEADDSCEDNIADDCCSDLFFQFQTDKEFTGKTQYLTIDLPVYLSVKTNYFVVTVEYKNSKNTYSHYTPPDKDLDKQALYQTYLI